MAKKKYNKSTINTAEVINVDETTNNEVVDTIDTNVNNKTEIDDSLIDETKIAEEIVYSRSDDDGPIYQIRTSWENIATQKGSYTDINEAIKECNKYPGYKVFNEAGVAIHVSTAPVKISSNNTVLYPGKKYDLNQVKTFASATINTPKAILSGVYYLYDAKLINGRYRIVDSRDKVEKGLQFVIGYVVAEDLL